LSGRNQIAYQDRGIIDADEPQKERNKRKTGIFPLIIPENSDTVHVLYTKCVFCEKSCVDI